MYDRHVASADRTDGLVLPGRFVDRPDTYTNMCNLLAPITSWRTHFIHVHLYQPADLLPFIVNFC